MTTEAKEESDDALRMIEFFSGIGGMRLSVQGALLQQQRQENGQGNYSLGSCQAYDISLHANKTYKFNFKEDTVSTKLVEQLKAKDLDGKADLWTMSPPCQPFTRTRGAKLLDMDDKRCNGLKAIMKLLTDMEQKPRYILLENVKGFSSSRMIEFWKDCLTGNGYTWKEYLLSPSQLGIPNHRTRYYMICEQSDRWKGFDGNLLDEFPGSSKTRTRQPTPIAKYIDNSLSRDELSDYVLPDEVLKQDFAKSLGIVTGADVATHCFTAGYGRVYHKATGSVLLMKNNDGDDENTADLEAMAAEPIDRSDMMEFTGRLRRFTPKELLSLFGFPATYSFPPELTLEHQYKLIGNSINVVVVTEILKELFSKRNTDSNNTSVLDVGGDKGHVSEQIDGDLVRLYEAFRWKMIPNCTGRYTCREHRLVSPLAPMNLLAQAGIDKQVSDSSNSSCLKEYTFAIPGRPDNVIVIPVDGTNSTGVITFEKKKDGDSKTTSYVHTLNTPSGFRRKLNAIGITVTDTDIFLQKEQANENTI